MKSNQQRSKVARAFRRLARGVQSKAAYARTIDFYRASGQPWTAQLG